MKARSRIRIRVKKVDDGQEGGNQLNNKSSEEEESASNLYIINTSTKTPWYSIHLQVFYSSLNSTKEVATGNLPLD